MIHTLHGDLHHRYNIAMAVPDSDAFGLPPVFSPAQAAVILRGLGLEGLTECALRTRAYRRQIPFHQNGRRIIFTVEDLREIAEGQPHRPEPRPKPDATVPAARPPTRHRRPPSDTGDVTRGPWRARRSLSA
jgi:hypothetical protein